MGKTLIVAVTGGIGSGKTEFCKFLAEKGYPVINADKKAKEILLKDPSVKKKIIEAFGEKAYPAKGLDTAYLADKVFSDAEGVASINAIVHPVVIKEINAEIKEYSKKNKFIFVEAALIYEAEMEEMFNYVVLVTAPEPLRLKRVLEKGKMSEEDIKRRIESQIPEEDKKEWADFSFENSQSLEDLKKKAEFLISVLNAVAV
ncbi:MAG: dephospho-CoA kinase [Ignavibacteria bacterium]|jgi:dephospho-CoA kinase|nr:dephospho-CoA kinase [Ignavibacteria bacterium]MCU7502222.1 dephospho-CoA kinase [Ignavibacteria bacterium]MCU7517439.1 dephospho-CoA kinase [Ignavibacteria bacterium]